MSSGSSFSGVSPILKFLTSNLDIFTNQVNLLDEAYNHILAWMTEEGRQPEHIQHLITNHTIIVSCTSNNAKIRILLSLASIEAVALSQVQVLEGAWEEVVVCAVDHCSSLRGVGFPKAFIYSRFRKVQALSDLVHNVMFEQSFYNKQDLGHVLCLNMFIFFPFVIDKKCKDSTWSMKVFEEIQNNNYDSEVRFVRNKVKMTGKICQLSRYVHDNNPWLLYEEIDLYLSVFKSVATLVHWIEHCNTSLLGRRNHLLRPYVETSLGDVTDAILSIEVVVLDGPVIAKLQSVRECLGLGTRTQFLPSELIRRDIYGSKTCARTRFKKFVYSSGIVKTTPQQESSHDDYYINLHQNMSHVTMSNIDLYSDTPSNSYSGIDD